MKMHFLRCKKKAKKDFCNLPEGYKTNNRKLRKLAWDGLQKNVVMDGDMMIDRRTGEELDPEVDFTYWKDKF